MPSFQIGQRCLLDGIVPVIVIGELHSGHHMCCLDFSFRTSLTSVEMESLRMLYLRMYQAYSVSPAHIHGDEEFWYSGHLFTANRSVWCTYDEGVLASPNCVAYDSMMVPRSYAFCASSNNLTSCGTYIPAPSAIVENDETRSYNGKPFKAVV